MKVLIIAQYFPPDMGGGATRAYNAAKGLALNGCKVTVITAFPHYPSGNIPERYRWKPFVLENVEEFKVVRTFVPPIASQGLVKRIVLFLSFVISSLFAVPFVEEVDVVWAANPNVLSVFPAMFYGFVKRKPVALNVDDLWPEDLHNFGLVKENSLAFKLMRFLAKLAYSSARLITPISPGYVRVLCGRYGVHHKKVCVVRAGVNLKTFRIIDSHSNPRRRAFRVLYSGAFSVAYDFDQVLKAAKRLEVRDDIEFILQGGGELANYLKGRVKDLGLKNIKIIDEIVSRDEVARLLGEADALILPLRDFGKPYLGLSSKLYEYQAAGKPVICCAEGQPAEYVEETVSGIVVKPGDYEALAKAVLYLRENRDIGEKLGTSGRQYVENSLSIEKIGLKMIRVFQQVLANRSGFPVKKSTIHMRILPSKQELNRSLGEHDFFLWEYYGEGVLGKILAWIFRSRIKVLMKFLRQLRLKPRMILDVGCGPMFISYALIRNEAVEYIGVDIMPTDRLKKYRDAMRSFGVKMIEVVRASAESLPFRREVFDFALSLDVLEHLSKPRKATAEIYRAVKDDGAIAISLPLENLFQRLSRIGFVLMKIAGSPILKRAKEVSITKTPEYHYVGDVKSYDDMVNLLKENFNLILTKYTPIGIHRSININAVHILKKKI